MNQIHAGAMSAAVLVSAAFFAACSSSSTTVTSPTEVRCAIQLAASPATMDAAGGSGQVAITTNRDCTWSARSESDWITLAAPTSGQGDAMLRFAASANPLVETRRGWVQVNDGRVEVAQAGASCRFQLSAPGGDAAAAGATLTVRVAAPASCAWTAVSEADWVRVDNGSQGSGDGVVTLSVLPNTGAARESTVLVAGQPYLVSQSAASVSPPPPPPPPPPGCQFTVAPLSAAFTDTGGDGTLQVAASSSACPWVAASSVPWISIVTTGGNGSGNARFVVAANSGAARTGTLTVAGVTIRISQDGAPPPPQPPPPPPPACEFTVSPQSESFGLNGGNGSIRVTASTSSCAWSAVSNASWVAVTSGSGTGNGNAQYTVAANTGPARTGTVTVAGTTVTITQAGCSFTVSPLSQSFTELGGTGTIHVDASGSSCPWTATSGASWITVATGNGAGDGNVPYVVAPNTGAARTASVTVAGATVTMIQAAAPIGAITLTGRISGLSGQCPALAFTLEGRTVRTSTATVFESRCDRIRSNDNLTVNGVVQGDSSVLAVRVREND